jgi:hypothetical protein
MSATASRALEDLKTSILFSPGFPRRLSFTHAQHMELVKERREDALYEAGIAAIRRAGDQVEHLRTCVNLLAEERYGPAVPLLSRLWVECALDPVWVAVGHALFAIGTQEALAALLFLLEDQEHFAQHMAIKAVFARGSGPAYEYFDTRFGIADGRHWVLWHVFSFLSEGGLGSAPHDNLRDPRWLAACARHRRDSQLGSAAREVLRDARPADREVALRAARAHEGPPLPPRTQHDGSLLRRYQAGEHEAVWREIRACGTIAGNLRSEVLEVAEAAMQRVAQNADLIAGQLSALGWRPLYAGLRTPPRAPDEAQIERLVALSGAPVPPTLLAFWRVVGGINWVWDYDAGQPPDPGFDLPLEEHDALCIHAPESIEECLAEWTEENEDVEPELREPLRIDLAPDYLHKANISGGMPYGVELPFAGADPVVRWEPHELPLLDYLRVAFHWAGFPGLDRHAHERKVQDFVTRMTRDLVTF